MHYGSYLLGKNVISFLLQNTHKLLIISFLSSLCSTESVYDLLPKELQLPPSRETSVASMSQTSGGEAGSPPPAVVAAGKSSHFFPCFAEGCDALANMNSAGKVPIVKKSLWRSNRVHSRRI